MGKTASKLRRSRSEYGTVEWSIRTHSLNKTMAPIMQSTYPHMEIDVWLEVLDLRQYAASFRQFVGVEELLHFTETDVKHLGITKSAHRARIVSSLVALRDKAVQMRGDSSSGRPSKLRHKQRFSLGIIRETPATPQPDPDATSMCTQLHSSNIRRPNPGSKSLDDLLADNRMADLTAPNLAAMAAATETGAASTPSGAENGAAAAVASQSANNETLALRRALDWELSLDSRDLRSHAWYHGPIPRQRAEEIVQRDGDFLIRDCVSQPGNFVLTCKTAKGPTLHFVINKILIQAETVYERVQYQFEDDAYDTVPDLITFYVGSGKAISAASGARIQSPCNRAYPLSFYASKYGQPGGHNQQRHQQQHFVSPLNSPSMVNAGFRFNPYNALQQHQQQQHVVGNYNSYRSPMSSPPRSKRDMPPKLPTKKQQRSQSLTPIQQQGSMSDRYCSADGVCRGGRPDGPQLVRSSTETRRLQLVGGGGSTEKCNSADGVILTGNGCMIRSSTANSSVDEHSASGDGEVSGGKFGSTQSSTMSLHMSRSSNGAGDHHHPHHPLHHSHHPHPTAQQPPHHLQYQHKFSTHSLSRIATSASSHRLCMPPTRTASLTRGDSVTSFHSARGFDANRAAVAETDEPDSSPSPPPPPKPQRGHSASTLCINSLQQAAASVDTRDPLNRLVSYHASGSDSGNGSGDSAQSSAAGDPLDAGGGGGSGAAAAAHRSGVHIKNPRFMSASASSATLKSFGAPDCCDYAAIELALLDAQLAQLEVPTRFDLENFETLLLPATENRPLDNGALNTIRMMLSETGPRVLAAHLTRVDIRLILELNAEPDAGADGSALATDRTPLDCATGVELVAMAHGEQFRRDLVERTECLRLLVAVTVLTCNCDAERADTLNKWIQVAVDTKTALGNLFGFCAIMLGLCMPQIQRLESAWHILRQRYTDSAFNFEAKLRPTLKSMNDCSNPQAPNTTVPHLLPYILLRDRNIDDILGTAPPTSTLTTSCITPWETSAADFGISIMFAHLDAMRTCTRNLPMYQRNAQSVMSDSSSRLDELLEDAFRTEFHMKFLWGSKGAMATALDRHMKMEQLLTLMADKHFASQQSGAPAPAPAPGSTDRNGTAV